MTMPPDDKRYISSFYTSVDRTGTSGTDTHSYRLGSKQTRVHGIYETSLTVDSYYDDLQPDGTEHQLSKALVPGSAWTYHDVNDPPFSRRDNTIITQIGAAMKGMLMGQPFI